MEYNLKIETLAEAIMKHSGYMEPDSEFHTAKNPGRLRAYSMKHKANDNGYRIFFSHIDGFRALMHDLHTKVNERNWSQLQPTHTLEDLASSYELPIDAAMDWAKFLQSAFRDNTICSKTQLKFFI